MAKMMFSKMHGAGNDYIYVDCTQLEFPYDPAAVSRALSPRHFAVGADGLVLILPSQVADFEMRIFNADGSEARMCGNASRCVAKYAYERGLTSKTDITLDTPSGIKALHIILDEVREGAVASVAVDMGVPSFDPAALPARVDGLNCIDKPLSFGGAVYNCTLVSVGNPHAVLFFKDDIHGLPLAEMGPSIERADIFPDRVNVEFVRVLSRDQIAMRVWERGSGETLACGTGACAAALAAIKNGHCEKKLTVHLTGGDLIVEWREDGHVYMTGPAAFCYDGSVDDHLWL